MTLANIVCSYEDAISIFCWPYDKLKNYDERFSKNPILDYQPRGRIGGKFNIGEWNFYVSNSCPKENIYLFAAPDQVGFWSSFYQPTQVIENPKQGKFYNIKLTIQDNVSVSINNKSIVKVERPG